MRLQDPSPGLCSWERATWAGVQSPVTHSHTRASIGFLLLMALGCCSWFLIQVIIHRLNLKWLFGLDLFSVKTVTWAEKAMAFTGNTQGLVLVQFQVTPGKPGNCSVRDAGVAVGSLG